MATKQDIKLIKKYFSGLGYTPKTDELNYEKFNDAFITTLQKTRDEHSIHWIIKSSLYCLKNWKKIQKIFNDPKQLKAWDSIKYSSQKSLRLLTWDKALNQIIYTNGIKVGKNRNEEGFMTGAHYGVNGLPITHNKNKYWIGTADKNYWHAYFKLIRENKEWKIRFFNKKNQQLCDVICGDDCAVLDKNQLSFDMITDNGILYIVKRPSKSIKNPLYTIQNFESREVKGLQFTIIRQDKDRKDRLMDSVVLLMDKAIDVLIDALDKEANLWHRNMTKEREKVSNKTLNSPVGFFLIDRLL